MYNKNHITHKKIVVSSICISLLIVLLSLYFFKLPILKILYKNYMSPSPKVTSTWESAPDTFKRGDIYVSTSGCDTNDGTEDNPFFSIERALAAVEAIDKSNKSEIIVCIEAGTYNIHSLDISPQHGGTEKCRIIYTSYGEGEVVLNSGISINPNDFTKVESYPEIYKKLPLSAKNNVYVLNLTKDPYNLNQEDWGKIYPIGTYNITHKYQGNNTGPMYSELFINGKRQSLARYPNEGYIYTGAVISSGKELDNKSNGDPYGDVFEVDESLAARIQTWSNLEDVWMYGFWQYDWADGSSPIESFDKDTNQLTSKYQSFFGITENAPYYFYNCLEELDSDNEWYLDRENGLLCVYSTESLEKAEINMSISTDTAITVNSNFVTLNNLTVTGTRGDGIHINGDGNIITSCKIHNIGGHAVQISGFENVITKSEISNTGKGGIFVVGGDRTSLREGNNLVSNNLIHDWSQIYKTYQAGIDLGGVGNICSNNELFNSPHLAITYSGNNHILEYNLIYNVCLESNDAGAIYAGKSWSSYGNDIRYNLIYNLGSDKYSPNGIYMDDALSGQNIYGNILINVPNHAIFIGGGRDMNVYENMIINSGNSAVRYDARARDALLSETWFSADINGLWDTLYESPWKNEIWQEAFPQYKIVTDDISLINESEFMANPANSCIKNNIVFDKCASLGDIDEAVYCYSAVSENKTYYLLKLNNTFDNYKDGNYLMCPQSPMYSEQFNYVFENVGRH